VVRKKRVKIVGRSLTRIRLERRWILGSLRRLCFQEVGGNRG
jgi:hypothetical protein